MQKEDFKPFEKATDILVVGKVDTKYVASRTANSENIGLALIEIMHHDVEFALLILASAEAYLQEKPEMRLDPVEA